MKLLVAILFASLATAQITVPLIRSTLQVAAGAADTQVTVTGAVPIIPDSRNPGSLFVDAELMTILSIQTTSTYQNAQPSTVITVSRATGGTAAAPHNPGAGTYIGFAYQFIGTSLSGACSPGSAQYVNYNAQLWFNCVANAWVATSTTIQGGGGGTGNVSTAGTLPNQNVIVGASGQAISDSGIPVSSLVTLNGMQTIQNKSFSGLLNTFTNIPNSALPGSGATTINSTTCLLGGSCTIAGGGATTPATNYLLIGTGTVNGVGAGTPGVNYQGAFALTAPYYGNGTSTGIAGAITACGTSISCSVLAPPSYGTSEAIANFSLDPNNHIANGQSTMSANILIQDQRYGDAQFSNGLSGFCQSLQCAVHAWQANFYAPINGGTANSQQYLFNPIVNAYSGGSNVSASYVGGSPSPSGGYINKTSYNSITGSLFAPTRGQLIAFGNSAFHPGTGDTTGIVNFVRCAGGMEAYSDEGCQAMNSRVYQNNSSFAATLTGSPTNGSTSLTFTPTNLLSNPAGLNATIDGEGRTFVDLTTGTYSTGTISAIVSSGTALTQITGSGTGWPISTAYGTTTAEVNTPGASTLVTLNFGGGTISAITTSTPVCIGDAVAFERVLPTSVTGSGFYATFRKVHATGAPFGVAGVCGRYLDLTADEVTSSKNSPTVVQDDIAVQGTLRWYWPLVYSTSATNAYVWVASAGAYAQLYSNTGSTGSPSVTHWSNTSGNNGYVFYQGAEAVKVGANNAYSQTAATLEPNTAPWTVGDSIDQGLYPSGHFAQGNNIIQFYNPCFPTQACGLGYIFNAPMQGADTLLGIKVQYPTTSYIGGGGALTPPNGIYIGSPLNYGLQFLYAPGGVFGSGVNGSAISMGCQLSTSSCSNSYAYMWQLGSGLGNHHIWQDEPTGGYHFGLNADSTQMTFSYSSVLSSPYVGPVGSGAGYLGSPGNSFAAIYMNGMTACSNLPAAGEQCFYYQSSSNTFHVVNHSGTDTSVGSGSGNATSIQGVPVSATAPTSGQALVDTSGTYVPTSLLALQNGQGTCLAGTTTLQVNVCSTWRQVTGTSDTIATGDWGNLVTYSNSGTVNVSLPAATGSTGNFLTGWRTTLHNYGTGTVTVTPVSGTIGSIGTLTLLSGQSAQLISDGSNYQLGAGSMNGVLPVSGGGTGTSTPSLVQGTNVTITGSWPNQTISASGGGGGGTVNSGTGGQIAYYASTGTAVSGENTVTVNQLPGTLSLPPYMQFGGGLYIPADFMYQATLPSFSGYSTLSGTLTTAASTNGDYNAYSLYTAAFYQQTAAVTNSIESVFSIGETPSVSVNTTYGGIYVCDSTNNKIWQLVINIQAGQPPAATLGSSTVTSCTTANTPGAISVAFGNLYSGLIPHLKLFWTGGTLYAYQSLNGGITNKIIGTESVGTIASSGIVANSSELQIYSLKVQ